MQPTNFNEVRRLSTYDGTYIHALDTIAGVRRHASDAKKRYEDQEGTPLRELREQLIAEGAATFISAIVEKSVQGGGFPTSESNFETPISKEWPEDSAFGPNVVKAKGDQVFGPGVTKPGGESIDYRYDEATRSVFIEATDVMKMINFAIEDSQSAETKAAIYALIDGLQKCRDNIREKYNG